MHMPAFGVLLRRVRHNRSVGHAWGSGPAFILRVEQLEDRVVPTNFVVTGTSDVGGTVDTGHAGTPADPFLATTLRAAIEQANTALDADTITFASGLSGQTISLASELLISNNLSISGAGLPLAPILNGGGTTRVLHITAIADVSLDSLVITGGKVTAATTPYASQGGNILLDSGTANITNCAITNGSSNAFGGGICTFVTASLTLVNSTVSGNTAGSGGAGLDVAGSAELTNVTIAGNTNSSAVTTTAGGMWISGSAANSVTIKNTIIAGNTGANPDLYKSGAGTLSVTNSLIGNATGNGLTNGTNGNRVGVAPLLGSLQDNGGATPTIALLTNSPAINAGNNSLVPVGLLTDQRGDIFARKVGTVDMGAFEVQPTQLIVDTLVDESDLDYSGGDLSLREAIQLANAAPGADTITFAAALYSGSPGTIPLSLGELPITNDLTITGPGANLLTIDAKHTSRVFFINDKNLSPDKIVTIDGLTITGGAIPSNQSGGAGIVNVEKLTLRNSTITGNSVTRTLGGGTGGGLLNTGTATIDSCLFSGNYAYRDGGAIGNGGNLTVQNSTLTGNTATDRGGAIASLISFAPVTLQNSTISGNTAGTGGGVYIATGSTLTIQNSLIAGNSASSQGREVRSQGTTSVSGNLFGCSTETTAQAVFGFTPGASNIVATSDGTNTPLSSILGTLQDNGGPTKTFALPSGSPAIDAGDDTL
ncbi:MAG: right-handed parallel beta-helix repeat-containing protein, partial [Planctomycetes bacterium]|nr:right-handed parallel beta-helix repeat-containing protein [Planctomycetota bacterium]